MGNGRRERAGGGRGGKGGRGGGDGKGRKRENGVGGGRETNSHIPKQLVELMHGSIFVFSEEGEGSHFIFDLLVEVPPEEAVRRFEEQLSGEQGGEREEGEGTEEKRETAEPVKKEEKKRDPKSVSILVAEDNLLSQKVVMAMLKQLGNPPPPPTLPPPPSLLPLLLLLLSLFPPSSLYLLIPLFPQHPSSSLLLPRPSLSLLIPPHPSSSLLIPPHPSSSLLIPPHPFSSLLIPPFSLLPSPSPTGYTNVSLAKNGQEAIDYFDVDPPKKYHVILMDCEMPVVDGFIATRTIRDKKIKIPIVAMTANAMVGDCEYCISQGMDDYLAKPVRLQSLADCIEKWT
jgi:CheY-like chemotaxis protein